MKAEEVRGSGERGWANLSSGALMLHVRSGGMRGLPCKRKE